MFGPFQTKKRRIRKRGKKMLHDTIFYSAKRGGRDRILRHLDRLYELGGGAVVRDATDVALVTLQVIEAPEKVEFLFQCCRARADQDPESRHEVFGHSKDA